MATGSLTLNDLLAVEHQPAASYGLDKIEAVVNADLENHNLLVQDMLEGLCEITTDRQRAYGSSQAGDMVEVDEFARSQSQGHTPSSTVAFPMRKFQFTLGWTSTWFKTHTPADMARAVGAAKKAHLRRIQDQIKYAVYRSANYTFTDMLVDKLSLNVKRFLNADGINIPDGPNGETFNGSTHTHYTAAASLAVANITATIDNVVEHGNGGMVKLAINRANETAIRSLSGFTPYVDPRLTLGAGNPEQQVDITRIDNRAIGILGAAEVWVKPWNPASYVFAYDEAAEDKPLGFRQRDAETLQGLLVAAALDTHPMYAQYMEAEFGVGVNNRSNGAVHYFAGGTYADPF